MTPQEKQQQREKWAREKQEKEAERHRRDMQFQAMRAVPNSLVKKLYLYPQVFRGTLSFLVAVVLGIINPWTLIATVPFVVYGFSFWRENVGEISVIISLIAMAIFAFYGNVVFGIIFLIMAAITVFGAKENHWLFASMSVLLFAFGTAFSYSFATFAYVFPASLVAIICFLLDNSYKNSYITRNLRIMYLKEAKESLSPEMFRWLASNPNPLSNSRE